ncbi:MAG: TIGR04013 family B12-binding domain/radical SAM domain-containing protein [Candidatus Thorarchaeota archaeon]|nr:TIGR04013 family B12-binding domain/radical SAM domain-containing protein [Candidatus Thorarchaeota archaeon]
MDSHTLIFRAHSSSRYSLAALVGVVETDHRLSELAIEAPIELSTSTIRKSVAKGPTILAHSVMSTQTDRIYKEVREVREKFGNSVTIVGGGPHVSARPMELLENGFDYVVIGEGEKTFPELLWYLMNDKDPTDILGVVGKITQDCPAPRDLDPVNLDTHPPFALGMNIVGPIEVTRGCPYSCKFCCTPFLTGGRVRNRSIDSITYWLTRAVERSGFDRTWFLSPNALSYGGRGRTVEEDKLEGLLRTVTKIEGLKEVFFGSFPSEVRPEFVTRPILEMMMSYVANKTLQIGLQSSSNRMLKLTNRHHTVEDGLEAINTTLDSGFIPHVDMIFGLPGETKKELHESIDLCQSLAEMGAKTHGHVFMPLPGSAYENEAPGRLDSESRKLLGELSRKKLLTGSWSTQESMAEILSSRKS